MILRDPWFLLLLTVLPATVWLRKNLPRREGLRFPMAGRNTISGKSWRNRAIPVPSVLRCAVLALVVVALARPQLGLERIYARDKGIDIALAVDVSTSMLAEDFTIDGRPRNRLEVVKTVVAEFIDRRPHDRLAMIVFGRNPYMLAPLTWDHDWLKTRLLEVTAGMVEDGTGIGAGLSAALNRLTESKAKSRVVILLTDGINNVNTISPETATEVAKSMRIKVYTIGAGSRGVVPYPFQDQYGRTTYRAVRIDLDEDLLRGIAAKTGGRYFRATDTAALRAIYDQINRMEKTEIEMPQYAQHVDLYPCFLIPALLLLVLEILLRHTVLRRLP